MNKNDSEVETITGSHLKPCEHNHITFHTDMNWSSYESNKKIFKFQGHFLGKKIKK